MSLLEVTFARDGADLTFSNVPPSEGFWLPEDGVGQIVRDLHKTYGPDSSYVRPPLLAVVEYAGEIPLTIYARAATSAALQALRDELEDAALQWSYDLTLAIDGVTRTYNAEIAMPVWAPFDSGHVRAHLDRCSLVIPVNP